MTIITDTARIDLLQNQLTEIKQLLTASVLPRLEVPAEPVYIDTLEAARICNYKSINPIRSAVERGELVAYGTSSKFRFLLHDVIEWRDSK